MDPVSPGVPPGAAPVLVVEAFSKAYDNAEAVRDLSFVVRPGTIVGLVGPNGAGKTTTLRSICGILPIKQGRILVGGFDIAHQDRQAKSCLAWVPDDPQPFDTLTVLEHMEFTAHLYGVADWRTRADELLRTFELVEKKDALGGELSRGMRQKLALCCAFITHPKLVLLDEPLTGLDPLGIVRAKDALRALCATGAAIILSSHLLDLVQELCHEIVILDRGRKVFAGTLDDARRTITAAPGSSLNEIFFAATSNGNRADVAPPQPAAAVPPSDGAPGS